MSKDSWLSRCPGPPIIPQPSSVPLLPLLFLIELRRLLHLQRFCTVHGWVPWWSFLPIYFWIFGSNEHFYFLLYWIMFLVFGSKEHFSDTLLDGFLMGSIHWSFLSSWVPIIGVSSPFSYFMNQSASPLLFFWRLSGGFISICLSSSPLLFFWRLFGGFILSSFFWFKFIFLSRVTWCLPFVSY